MNKLARFQQPPVASVSVTFSQQSGLGASGAGVIRRMATIPEINSPSPLSPNIPVIQPRTPTAQLYDLNINSPVQVSVTAKPRIIFKLTLNDSTQFSQGGTEDEDSN